MAILNQSILFQTIQLNTIYSANNINTHVSGGLLLHVFEGWRFLFFKCLFLCGISDKGIFLKHIDHYFSINCIVFFVGLSHFEKCQERGCEKENDGTQGTLYVSSLPMKKTSQCLICSSVYLATYQPVSTNDMGQCSNIRRDCLANVPCHGRKFVDLNLFVCLSFCVCLLLTRAVQWPVYLCLSDWLVTRGVFLNTWLSV